MKELLKQIPTYYTDQHMDLILDNPCLRLSVEDYIKFPRGYAETDNMTLEQAEKELTEWFQWRKIDSKQDPKEYRSLLRFVSKRITEAWLDSHGAKDVGRTIARYAYLKNKS
jgi:hypothetical protein